MTLVAGYESQGQSGNRKSEPLTSSLTEVIRGPTLIPSALQRLILTFTLRRDLGFRWLAQRSVADTP